MYVPVKRDHKISSTKLMEWAFQDQYYYIIGSDSGMGFA